MRRAAGRKEEPPAGGLALLALLWLLAVGAAPLLRLAAEGALGPGLPSPEDASLWRAARRSLAVSAGATLLALALGAAQAALLLLRAPRGRGVLLFLAVMPALVPPQVLALAFVQSATPSSPLLLALDLAPPIGTPNPFHGAGGMVLLLGLQGAPLVLLSVAALVRRLPGEAAMAALGLGASPGMARRRILWPLLLPGLVAGAGLAWVAALGNFGIAAILGLPGRYTVLSVLIWQRLSTGGATALAEVAGLSLLLALLALPGLVAGAWAGRQRGAARGTRPFEPESPAPGARAATALLWLHPLLVLGLPLLSLVTTSLAPALGVPISAETATGRHFAAALSPEARTAGALRNSLLLSGGAALLLAAAALPVALSRASPAVRLAAPVSDLAYALPGACVAVACILLVLSLPGGGVLYGTMGVILFAYLARFQSLALRPVQAAASRLDPSLDRAARGLGAGAWPRLLRVHLPLLAPALAAGGLLVALLAVNEVTLSSLLSGAGTQTLGILVFNLQDGGQGQQAAAVSLIALLLVAALTALASLAGRRLPPGTLPWRP